MSKRLLSAVLQALLAACVVTSALHATTTSSGGVVGAIEKKYVVTEVTADHEQITKDGTTMAMKCAGVYSVPSNMTLMIPENKVADGHVQAPGTLAKYSLVRMGAHVLQTGDKVYITKIDSKSDSNGDTLKFTILTVSSLDVNGQAAQKKYSATVSFKFKKGYLDDSPPEEVEQSIEAVMAPDEGGGESKGGSNAGEAQAQAPSQPRAQAQPQAQAQPAPPPPAPPVAAPPPTITIGESSTEVLQAMGMPLQMIDLGKKKTYVYKNMKIVFMNDKVSDVQ